jgi:hypothetical protein
MTYPYLSEPERIILDWQKVGIQMPTGLRDVEISEARDIFMDRILMRLKTFVLTERLANDTVTQSVEIPVTSWDMFKEEAQRWADKKPCRILTRWWLRKRPRKTRTLTLTATWTRAATRPESKIRFHDKLGPVVYQEELTHRFGFEDL